MSKLSIEQQISELTPEQKNNMGTIYKKYVLSLIAIVLAGVLAAAGLFVEATMREERARDEYDKIQTMIELNEMNNRYDFSLFDESLEVLDEQYEAKRDKSGAFVTGSTVSFCGILVVMFIFKKKYPYFSEKKYAYLKKMAKNVYQQ